MPLATNAATLSFCQVSRSSRTTTAIFVSSATPPIPLPGLRPGLVHFSRVPPTTGAEHVRAWQPALPGVREVFHARFVEHRYPPHTHDTWTVLIVDEGAIRYELDSRAHRSRHGTVTVLPPHVVHDGRAADHSGFRKRGLYVGNREARARLAA